MPKIGKIAHKKRDARDLLECQFMGDPPNDPPNDPPKPKIGKIGHKKRDARDLLETPL